MKKFLKSFPFTVYSTSVIGLFFCLTLSEGNQRDELSLIDPVLWIFILRIPLLVVSKVYDLFNIQASLPWVILPCLLLDLLLLSIRTSSLKNLIKKTYHKLVNLTKPKK